MRQGGPIRRRVGVIVIACVVLLGTAVPVLADPSEPAPEPPAAREVNLQASELSTPTPAGIAAAYQYYIREG